MCREWSNALSNLSNFIIMYATLKVYVCQLVRVFCHLLTVLVLDFRPVGVITESNGTVDTCIYVCDGQLKRNSSITVSFWNGTAQCEYISYYACTLWLGWKSMCWVLKTLHTHVHVSIGSKRYNQVFLLLWLFCRKICSYVFVKLFYAYLCSRNVSI